MSDATELARKLQLKPGSKFWVWPDAAPAAKPLTKVDGIEASAVNDADVALLFTENRQDVDEVMTQNRANISHARAVWIVYAKGNKTDMNRDTLWVQLARYGWRAVAQVSFDQKLSAIRVRPLKDGEASPV